MASSEIEEILTKDMIYSIKLRQGKAVYKIKDGVYAIPDCGKDGKTPQNSKYVIVERFHVQSKVFSICSCNIKQTSNILDALKLDAPVKSGSSDMCIHAKEAENLGIDREENIDKNGDEKFGNNKEDVSYKIWHLKTCLTGVYCSATLTYGIISKTDELTKCLTCMENVKRCAHVLIYNENETSNEQEIKYVEPLVFTSISSNKIPVPMKMPPQHPCPKHLVPSFNPAHKCKHGHLFSADDPISSKWVQNDKATIYFSGCSINCVVYYRPTTDNICKCRQFADGSTEYLINLDNKHLFPYKWLVNIMSIAQEMKMRTIKTDFKVAQRMCFAVGKPQLPEYLYEHLRDAYNCFLQLIDIN